MGVAASIPLGGIELSGMIPAPAAEVRQAIGEVKKSACTKTALLLLCFFCETCQQTAAHMRFCFVCKGGTLHPLRCTRSPSPLGPRACANPRVPFFVPRSTAVSRPPIKARRQRTPRPGSDTYRLIRTSSQSYVAYLSIDGTARPVSLINLSDSRAPSPPGPAPGGASGGVFRWNACVALKS